MERVLGLTAGEEWGEYEKKDWVEEVCEKMAAVLIVQKDRAG